MTKLKNLNCEKALQLLFLQDWKTLIEKKPKKKKYIRRRKKTLSNIILKKIIVKKRDYKTNSFEKNHCKLWQNLTTQT